MDSVLFQKGFYRGYSLAVGATFVEPEVCRKDRAEKSCLACLLADVPLKGAPLQGPLKREGAPLQGPLKGAGHPEVKAGENNRRQED